VAPKAKPPQTTKKQQFTPSTTQTKMKKNLGTIYITPQDKLLGKDKAIFAARD
jgi:hypothetical protein